MPNFYLSKLLPGFRRKAHPRSVKPPAAGKGHSPPANPPPEPRDAQVPRANVKHAAFDDPKMMDSLVAFLRRYLVCEEYQLDLLALWIVHTRCFQHFPTAAYLDIRSAEAESAKTLCMQLLNLLCDCPWMATGPTPATVIDRLLAGRSMKELVKKDGTLACPPPFTILVDNHHHTLGRSERQQVLAMLNSGSARNTRYVLNNVEYSLFGPKAFAGNARLPTSLASRCIPIVLKRKKRSQAVASFELGAARAAAANLLQWLDSLAGEPQWIIEKVKQGPPALPDWELTAREKDAAVPLLHIANAIGGSWPQKAAAAVISCFKVGLPGSQSLQVLSDVRLAFFVKKDPDYLFSRDLLRFLGGLEFRPWAGWSSRSGKRLGGLLERFGINSRMLNWGADKGLMGYLRKDFEDAWERYLQPYTAKEVADRDEAHARGGYKWLDVR